MAPPARGKFPEGDPSLTELGIPHQWGVSALAVCVPWVSHTSGLALRHGRSARFPHRCGMRTSRRGQGIPHRRGGSCVRTMGLAHLGAGPPVWSER